MGPRTDSRARAVSAAGICAAAAALNLAQWALPGGQPVTPWLGVASLALTGLLLAGGRRIPGRVMLAFGPGGTALIAAGMAVDATYTDGAVVYLFPAVWVAYFYGPAATAAIVAWTAVAHGVALSALPPGLSSLDRWLDVTVVVAVIAVVVQWIAARNGRLTRRLDAQARHDALTGLLNRRGFDERLAAETARAARDGRTLSAVAFDIDHFKAINDRHGHEAGDRVLERFGALLADEARAADVLARTGGEEFVALLPQTRAEEAAVFADRVRARAGGTPRWTVSAGVASAASPGELDGLLTRADDALYAAKAAGRDRVATTALRAA